MARRGGASALGIVAARSAEANENTAAEPQAVELSPSPEPAKPRAKGGTRAGKYHVGGYYDPADPVIMEFRMLGLRERRSQQELLFEAMESLLEKRRREKAEAVFNG